MVPASTLRYGSILIDVTRKPLALSSLPIDEIVMPLPRPLTTPPVTTMYFIWRWGAAAAAPGVAAAGVTGVAI